MINYYDHRNNKIVALADAGNSVEKIAAKYMLSEARVRKILRTHTPVMAKTELVSVKEKFQAIENAAAAAPNSEDKLVITWMIIRLANEIVEELEDKKR